LGDCLEKKRYDVEFRGADETSLVKCT